MTRNERPFCSLPPATYTQRKHQKNLRIRVTGNGITVSGPARCTHKEMRDFYWKKADWIKKAWQNQQEKEKKRRLLIEKNRGTLLIRGIRKRIIEQVQTDGKKSLIDELDEYVVLYHNPKEKEGKEAAVNTFYLKAALKELPVHLARNSKLLSVSPGKLSIRNQKTRWGSCSRKGNISLNWRLIKCPVWIVNYIIIHELVHLRHFNHSRAFWQEVTQCFPETDKARKWIRQHEAEVFTEDGL